MAFSVNTNVGAMAALQSLSGTNKSLATTQSRINTGLAVNSTKDDSASYTIAQKLRGDVSNLKAVTSSLNRGKSVVDVAVNGAEQVSDLLNQMKSKTVEIVDKGQDTNSRTQITADINALKETIESVISSSEFNGSNLLKEPATAGDSEVHALTSTTDLTATLDVANQGLDTKAGATLGAKGTPIAIADADAAEALSGEIDTFQGQVKDTLSTLGSASRKIENQLSFNSKLSDVIESGIGNLVDADLAKESAQLQALQVKQQLGVQALSIANQAPQSIMSLFR